MLTDEEKRQNAESRIEKMRFDRCQVAGFQMFFKYRLDEMSLEMAFATAIADTSDDKFEQAKTERMEQIERWISDFGSSLCVENRSQFGRKKLRRSADFELSIF